MLNPLLPQRQNTRTTQQSNFPKRRNRTIQQSNIDVSFKDGGMWTKCEIKLPEYSHDVMQHTTHMTSCMSGNCHVASNPYKADRLTISWSGAVAMDTDNGCQFPVYKCVVTAHLAVYGKSQSELKLHIFFIISTQNTSSGEFSREECYEHNNSILFYALVPAGKRKYWILRRH